MLSLKHMKIEDLPLGGKYDLLSALCGQSTTSGPNLLNAAVISSEMARMCESIFYAIM